MQYQVGDLVASIPLAPGSKRTYSKKSSVRRTTRRLSAEMRSASERAEQSSTDRVESEIVRRASQATNFRMTSEGSFNFGIGQVGGTSEFGGNQASESAQTKRSLRETVLKVAQEYRSESKLEIETGEQSSQEQTESVAHASISCACM